MDVVLSTYVDKDGKEMKVNIPYEELYKPHVGPLHPNKTIFEERHKNTLTGYAERVDMSDFNFETQRRTFTSFGYAINPVASNEVIGNVELFKQNQGGTIYDKTKGNDKKRKDMGNPSDIEAWQGPWAGFEGENIPYEPGGTFVSPTNEELVSVEIQKAKKLIQKHSLTQADLIKPGQERSIFHGKSEKDYLGRTYITPPNDIDIDLNREPGHQQCFLPKKLIHTYIGHSEAVTNIRFFPNSGHLILSGGMDAKVKIWDVYHERKCLRTFIGHNKAIRDINFRSDGRQFLSCGYDKFIKIWDTETGACIKSIESRATPYCGVFHPASDQWNMVMAGCANKRIYSWDLRMEGSDISQEYNQHLDAVNSITFIDEDRKFVSTSDDKSVRVWEFGIPVTIKTIAEPYMHSIPVVTPHPNKKWLLGQSMSNKIVTFSVLGEKFRPNNKKFVGHLTSGHACQVSCSPDGEYVMSGDAEGKLWFWAWKHSKLIKTIKAHDKPSIGAIWHPQETSKVATCSWDGTIKYWD